MKEMPERKRAIRLEVSNLKNVVTKLLDEDYDGVLDELEGRKNELLDVHDYLTNLEECTVGTPGYRDCLLRKEMHRREGLVEDMTGGDQRAWLGGGMIIGMAIGLVVIVLLVIFYCCCKGKKLDGDDSDEEHEGGQKQVKQSLLVQIEEA